MKNEDIEEKIKIYAKLRGKFNKGINYKTLKQAFLQATPQLKKMYLLEMEEYLNAINNKDIVAGDSIFSKFLSKNI